MKQQEVFKKIGVIIKELNEQYEYLKTIDGQLNELELELFIANSNFLTDHVVILTKLNSKMLPAPKPEPQVIEEMPLLIEKAIVEEPHPIAEEKPVIEDPVEEEKPVLTEEKLEEWPPVHKQEIPAVELPAEEPETPHEPVYFEPLVQVVNPVAKHETPAGEDKQPTPQIDLETGSKEDSYSYTREDESGTIRHELILNEADFADEDEDYETALVYKEEEPIIETPPAAAKPVVIENIEELRPVIEPPQQVVKELAKEDVLTINERISAQLAGKAANLTEQVSAQKVDDLKQAINLNDKLLYIRDLFNGYSLAYSEAIDLLNRFNNFEEADTFLKKNYMVKNNWEKKPETTEKLYALLKRRYA
jgi:hypothetical protein